MKYFLIFAILISTFGLSAQTKDADVEKKIDEIISQLTLEEKVKMCHAQSKFSTPGVERLGIPEIWMSDGPHGVRAEIEWDSWSHAGWTNDSCTAFPALTCLAASFNPDLAYKYGVAVGEEARYRKKDILLGPGVNIYRTPLNGRNFEYMGEDPYLASVMCVPYIQGVQTNGVAACVKHYVLNNQEIWRGHIDVNLSDRALYEIYLPAFKAAVQEGDVWSIMGAYNKYNGQHTSHHQVLMNDILKGDWGFDGVVVTDWGSAHDTKEAALNGLDIEMGTGTDGLTSSTENAYDHYYLAKPFLEMLKSGEIEESVVDDKVRRILRLMYRTNMDRTRPFGSKASQAHFNVAREVAQEGIVLLKNDKKFFPLNPETTQTIAVIGENATRMMTVGGGSSELKTVHEISPLQGIQERFAKANVIHAMGYASGPSQYGRVISSDLNADSLKRAAVLAAQQADIVLFVGGLNKNHEQDCENGDRASLNLPFGQDELLSEIMAINKNVGVILVSGNAVAMPWQAQAKGIIQAWYLGSETGYALAGVLSGDINPSGKLPFSFPVTLEDNGAHAFDELSYPGDGVKQVYKEDILVGYRWHDTKKIKPLYAFGYGLSYTSFKINKVTIAQTSYKEGDEVKLSIEISNVGEVDGAEVIQVYVHDEQSSVIRPVKELKAFKKVKLAAGTSKMIEMALPVDSFAFYDETQDAWKLEKGTYQLLIGTASDSIRKSMKINIK